MPSKRSLTLLAPRIGADLSRAMRTADHLSPELARLAGRGVLSQAPSRGASAFETAEPTHEAILQALNAPSDAAWRSGAAIMASGACNQPRRECWLRATPIHFIAGLDRLTAVNLAGEQALNEPEREQLAAAIVPHLEQAGFELVSVRGEWLIKTPEPLDAETAAPQAASANPLESVMPRGRDARALRRLMTELQMLLHEHPVNLARAQRGKLEANAVWLHALGSVGELTTNGLPIAHGDDLFLRGLYVLQSMHCEPAPRSPAVLLEGRAGNIMAVIETDSLAELDAHWLGELARALRSGALDELTLVLDAWRIRLDRAALLKFWRTARPPHTWPGRESSR